MVYGINPALLERPAYNAAFVSQSLDVDAAILKTYLPRAPRLRTVILTVDYTAPGYRLHRSAENWRAKNYLLYTPVEVPHKPAHHFEVLSLPLPISAERIWEYYVENKDPDLITRNLGFAVSVVQGETEFNNNGRIAAGRHTNYDELIRQENEASLVKIAELCLQANVKLQLITLPYHEDYMVNREQSQVALQEEMITNLTDQFSNVSYDDTAARDQYSENNFRDSDHLNERGATVFTTRLNALLRGGRR
ncbi:hypothetical protein [Neolewinella antarctica]|uniref:SGNH/GDSL hydrolase family protein n=1 Tax=Neolewinella antarctica TaxID=442734 RepID=A0ABX0XCS5_9BACT|nr:hypothetical protein [Neolewinella antarctica]NJC27061.1 hypothetical protein [Neolewinella antarctica]